MSEIPVTASGFSGQYTYLNGNSTLTVSDLDIIRSIITVGAQQPSYIFQYGQHGFLKNIALSCMALCVLDFGSPNLTRSPLFNSFDSSEKAIFSYWLGMCFAKLYSEREMSMTALAHADPLIEDGVATLKTGSRSRGDLLGLDTAGNWHVFEAKGRSNSVELNLLTNAKTQAKRIEKIQNMPPETTCVSLLHFYDEEISLLIQDPKPDSKNPVSLEINQENFFLSYYRIIIEYLSKNNPSVEEKRGLNYVMAQLPYSKNIRSNLSIGLLESIYNKDSDPLLASQRLAVLTKESEIQKVSDSVQQSFGIDGILIEETPVEQPSE